MVSVFICFSTETKQMAFTLRLAETQKFASNFGFGGIKQRVNKRIFSFSNKQNIKFWGSCNKTKQIKSYHLVQNKSKQTIQSQTLTILFHTFLLTTPVCFN